MKMSNETYDVWNKIQRWLPAIAVLYLALAQIWDLPFGDEINNTILAITTFLASILEVSSVNYYKKVSVESINNYDTVDPDENHG